MPSQPSSSARTGPKQAPTRMQIAAPENQVTSDRPMPKKPNWASFSSTTPGIQTVAETAYKPRRDAGDQPGGEQHPRPHVAEQEVPGHEPPDAGRHREPHDGDHADSQPAVDALAPPPQDGHADQHEGQADGARARTCPTPEEGGRRHARRYVRWRAVTNEAAKNSIRKSPRKLVASAQLVGRRERLAGEVQRVAPQAQPEGEGGEDRRPRAARGGMPRPRSPSGRTRRRPSRPARCCGRGTRSPAGAPTPAR